MNLETAMSPTFLILVLLIILISFFRTNGLRVEIYPLFIFLSACNTRPLPPANLNEDGWKVQQGQAVWRAKKDAPELAGEILYAQNPDGRTMIQFTKTPFPFVIAQTTPTSWQLEVPAQNKAYSAPGKPPARISWFHLPPALAGAPPPKPWIFRQPTNENWQLENKSTGELIEGYLAP